MNNSVKAFKLMSVILELFSCLTARARRILINQSKLPGSFIKFTFIKFKFLLIFPAPSLPLCALSAVTAQILQPLVVARGQPQSLTWLLPITVGSCSCCLLCSSASPPSTPECSAGLGGSKDTQQPHLPMTLVINSQILTVE